MRTATSLAKENPGFGLSGSPEWAFDEISPFLKSIISLFRPLREPELHEDKAQDGSVRRAKMADPTITVAARLGGMLALGRWSGGVINELKCGTIAKTDPQRYLTALTWWGCQSRNSETKQTQSKTPSR